MSNINQSLVLYQVHCLDAPGKAALRASLSDLHRAYMLEQKEKILIGGPLLDEQTKQRIGSSLIIGATSREQVEGWLKKEPYQAGGVFESVTIRRFECVMFKPELLVKE